MAWSSLQRLLRRAPAAQPTEAPGEFDALSAADRALIEPARPYTMTSVARLQANVDAVRYVHARRLPGAIVECGVWRGGSVMAMILTLQSLGETERDVFLFDTFEGMTAPTEHDVSPVDGSALVDWNEAELRNERAWSEVFGSEVFDEQSVRDTLLSTGYPAERIHLCKGPVEETVPDQAPSEIALLRLDTDWYESTRHELVHLYPRLAVGGVLIIDDYGHWEGCARAVDEYMSEKGISLLLNRTDYTGRMAIKA